MTNKVNLLTCATAAITLLCPYTVNAEALSTGDTADIAGQVLEGVGEGLDALAAKKRSAAILIRNHTDYSLKSGEFETSTGELTGLTTTIPATKIETIQAYNSFGLKGTAGVVKYTIGDTGKALVVCWSIPLGYVTQENWFKYAVIDNPHWNADYGENLFDDMFNNKGKFTKGKLAKAVGGYSEWTTPGGWKVSGTMGDAANAVIVCDLYGPAKPEPRPASTPSTPVAQPKNAFYSMSFYTDDVRKAGTSSNVTLVRIVGSKKTITPNMVLNPKISGDAFERGETTTVSLGSFSDVGTIKSVEIKKDNKGLSPDWNCGKILVKKGATITSVFHPKKDNLIEDDKKVTFTAR